jgi:hypothetical protein
MLRSIGVAAVLVLGVAACGNDDDTVADDTVADDPAAVDDDYSIEDQPDDAAARWVSPSDGDTVSSPVAVEMAADGVEIVPVGDRVAGEAHLHVLVDIGCADDGEFLPGPSDEATDEGYNHFGDGSTEGEIELEPGTYELCLQLADGAHQAFGETDTIEITVE